MNSEVRPPAKPKAPTVLFVHNGSDYRAHVEYLTASGLRVTQTHPEAALAGALKLQPDLIVLDFGFDGVLTAKFKAHSMTRHIAVIALAELGRPAS